MNVVTNNKWIGQRTIRPDRFLMPALPSVS